MSENTSYYRWAEEEGRCVPFLCRYPFNASPNNQSINQSLTQSTNQSTTPPPPHHAPCRYDWRMLRYLEKWRLTATWSKENACMILSAFAVAATSSFFAGARARAFGRGLAVGLSGCFCLLCICMYV